MNAVSGGALYLQRAGKEEEITEIEGEFLRRLDRYKVEDKSPHRNAIINGIFISVVFDIKPLQQVENNLSAYKEHIMEILLELPKGALHQDLTVLVARMDALERQPDKLHPKRSELVADKAHARMCARHVVEQVRKGVFDGAKSLKREVCQVDHAVVKGRFKSFAESEELFEQLARLSLGEQPVPTWKLPSSQMKYKIQQDLFLMGPHDDHVVISPFVPFTRLSDLENAQKQAFFHTLTERSQLALLYTLELQPLDHHSDNIGISPSGQIVLFDNSHMLYASNKSVYFRTGICYYDKDATKFHRLHMVPLRSDLVNLESAQHPLSDTVIQALLNPKREKDLISWLERSYHPDVKAKTERYKEALQKMHEVETAERRRAEVICSLFILHSNLVQTVAEEKASLRSVLPRCTLGALNALKERLQLRRAFLEDCLAFRSTPTRELYKDILERESTPIPSTIKKSLGLDFNPKELAKWMVPSYKSIACAMFPLLADTLALICALKIEGKNPLGDYRAPLESLLYAYFKSQGISSNALESIRSYMLSNQNRKTSLLQRLSEIDYSHLPLHLEVRNILTTLMTCKSDFFLDTIAAIVDPNWL